jgi:aldehyde dehydrogenase (NAD+)
MDDLFIAGAWVCAHSQETIEVVEAATGRPLDTIADAGARDVDRAVEAARRALPEWAATDPADRAKQLDRLADALERRAGQIGETIARENGSPLALAVAGNVEAPAGILRYYAGLARNGFADDIRPAATYPGNVRIQQEPIGVVGAIVPFNFPLALAAMKLAPALAAGCTVVLKPAPETSLDAGLLVEAVAEAGLPAGAVNLITGGTVASTRSPSVARPPPGGRSAPSAAGR